MLTEDQIQDDVRDEILENLEGALHEWAEDIGTSEEFIDRMSPLLFGMLDAFAGVAQEKGFVSPKILGEFLMFLNYNTVVLASDVLQMSKEDFLKMCEMAFEVYHDTPHSFSDRSH